MFRLEQKDRHVRLTLDRAAARNAIPAASWSLLAEQLAEVGASGAQLLVVAGAGGAFCAGADLKDFAAMARDEDAVANFRIAMRGALDRLRGLSMPTVAVIEGACYGAGVALAMACDLRLAGAGARFAITPAKLGISYPQEDVHRLVALVGAGQAARLLFSAATIDGAEAQRIGLIEYRDEDEANVIAALSAFPPESLKALKQAIVLAGTGVSAHPDSDAAFDALLANPALGSRLEALRRT